jgi:hypothetical protein
MVPVSADDVLRQTFASWNMQGGSDGVDSKWQTGVQDLVRTHTRA